MLLCVNPFLLRIWSAVSDLAELHVIEGVPSLIFGSSSYTIEVTNSPSHVNLLSKTIETFKSNHQYSTPFLPLLLRRSIYISVLHIPTAKHADVFSVRIMLCFFSCFDHGCHNALSCSRQLSGLWILDFHCEIKSSFSHFHCLLIPGIEFVSDIETCDFFCRQWRRSASLWTTWHTSSRPMGAQPPLSVGSVHYINTNRSQRGGVRCWPSFCSRSNLTCVS